MAFKDRVDYYQMAQRIWSNPYAYIFINKTKRFITDDIFKDM
jgi:hypothetical protein